MSDINLIYTVSADFEYDIIHDLINPELDTYNCIYMLCTN